MPTSSLPIGVWVIGSADGLDAETLSAKKFLPILRSSPAPRQQGRGESSRIRLKWRSRNGRVRHRRHDHTSQIAAHHPDCRQCRGLLGTVGIISALRRRAVEGGSYRVTVFLTRTVLWLLLLAFSTRTMPRALPDFQTRTQTSRRIVHRGDPVGHLSGNDRSGRPVEGLRAPSDGPRAARLEQTRMAGKLRQ